MEVQEAITRLKEAILKKLGDTLKDTEVDPEILAGLSPRSTRVPL